MTANEWLEVMKQAQDFPKGMEKLIVKYGEMLITEQEDNIKKLTIPDVICSNCPKVIGLTIGKVYQPLAKHKDLIAIINDYGDFKIYNMHYFE